MTGRVIEASSISVCDGSDPIFPSQQKGQQKGQLFTDEPAGFLLKPAPQKLGQRSVQRLAPEWHHCPPQQWLLAAAPQEA